MTNTNPTGPARGGLAGNYPAPAVGSPNLVGIWAAEDFIGYDAAAVPVGQLGWIANYSGGTGSIATDLPDYPYWFGSKALNTASASGAWAILHTGMYNYRITANTTMPAGIWYAATFAMDSTADTSCFAGLLEQPAYPTGSTFVDFVGMKYDSAVGTNWYAVCRNGATETAVDTGIAATVGSFTFKFEADETGVTFYSVDSSNRFVDPELTQVARIETNRPNEALAMAFGVYSGVAAAKTIRMDSAVLGGRVARTA